MEFILISALLAVGVTILAAWLIIKVRPNIGRGTHLLCSVVSFPILSAVLFVLGLAIALLSSTGEASGSAGMPILALTFFLFYALVIGVVLGVPTAFVAVTALRR
ncbi:hypothetical protein FHS96_001029 [Sphingomonas zeicaulis]|uniref:hypothetical protein n=1 Tax=Sphingomonas zeicaulis TaxID=1632740 RepID=UPI003D237E75